MTADIWCVLTVIKDKIRFKFLKNPRLTGFNINAKRARQKKIEFNPHG